MKAFQDHYPENVSHCYGCGSQNQHGHRIRTFWDGDETVTRYTRKSGKPQCRALPMVG